MLPLRSKDLSPCSMAVSSLSIESRCCASAKGHVTCQLLAFEVIRGLPAQKEATRAGRHRQSSPTRRTRSGWLSDTPLSLDASLIHAHSFVLNLNCVATLRDSDYDILRYTATVERPTPCPQTSTAFLSTTPHRPTAPTPASAQSPQ